MEGPDNEIKTLPRARRLQTFAICLSTLAVFISCYGGSAERALHEGTLIPTHQVGASKVPDVYHGQDGGATPTIRATETMTPTLTPTQEP